MKLLRHARPSALALALGLSTLLVCGAYADTPSAGSTKPVADITSSEPLRAEISEPLAAAQLLFQSKKYTEALVKIAQADGVSNKSPREIYVVELSRANNYVALGDKANAVKAFEAIVAAHYLKNTDQLNVTQVIGQMYFELLNYPSAILWMEKYIKEGGGDSKAKVALYQAQYLNKDYSAALKGINADIEAQVVAGQIPTEQSLKLLVSCNTLINDKDGTLTAIEQLNSYYPTAKNWLYLLDQVRLKPGFSERMYLDMYRLKQELSLMTTAVDYVDMADLAAKAGLPAEAKKAIDQGFTAGLLDKGVDAKKYANLKHTIEKRAADDLKTMQQDEASVSNGRDGAGLVNLGMAFATAGQLEKGASLMQRGISKGGFSRLNEAKLNLGIVYYWSGKKEDAIKQFISIRNPNTRPDVVADLARYWVMQINHPLTK